MVLDRVSVEWEWVLSSVIYALTALSQHLMGRDLIAVQFILKVDSFNIHHVMRPIFGFCAHLRSFLQQDRQVHNTAVQSSKLIMSKPHFFILLHACFIDWPKATTQVISNCTQTRCFQAAQTRDYRGILKALPRCQSSLTAP